MSAYGSNFTFTSSKRYRCNCGKQNLSGTTKNANQYSGSGSNYPGFLITNPYLMSTQIHVANIKQATKIKFGKRRINAFKRWDGAPGGSGQPIKNIYN